MSAPESYLTGYDEVCESLKRVSAGEVREICRSPGGRAVHAVSYGEFEPVERAANLSSAVAAGKPEAFYGPGRQKPVLLVCSAVHGGEMESIAGVMNLISLMETGSDLDGVEWPRLRDYAGRLRLVIVPVANPDGRARVDSDDPVGWGKDEVERYRHGLGPDGEFITWPACKVPHPRSETDSVLGGYFNDAGVNVCHASFFDPEIAPEAHAVADLCHDETADFFLDLHSCGAGPFFIVGSEYLSRREAGRQCMIDGAWRVKMRERGLPAPTWMTGFKPGGGYVLLQRYVHLRTGALPVTFEGGAGSRYTDGAGGRSIYRQIIETYMVLFETLCEVGVEEGFKLGS